MRKSDANGFGKKLCVVRQRRNPTPKRAPRPYSPDVIWKQQGRASGVVVLVVSRGRLLRLSWVQQLSRGAVPNSALHWTALQEREFSIGGGNKFIWFVGVQIGRAAREHQVTTQHSSRSLDWFWGYGTKFKSSRRGSLR